MAKINPFTEIVERTQDLTRSNADTKQRIRGIVNDVYTTDITKEFDWSWLKASSAISCIAQFNTGTVMVSTQGTVVTMSGATTIDTTFTGRKIKFADNPDVYDVTYLGTTGITISPPLSGATNISDGTYTIFKNIFSLPGDFDRFPVNGGLLSYSGGQPTPLPELMDDDYYAQVNASPTDVPDNCRMLGYDASGNIQVEILPPPASAYILKTEYIKSLDVMTENTAGTIVMTSNSLVVTGTATVFNVMSVGDYVRADNFGKGPDSVWYRIATITSKTNMTLSTVFRTDSNYTGVCTLSAAPKMPPKIQPAIMWGAIMKILPDQKDPMFIMAQAEYSKTIKDNRTLEQNRHSKDNLELIAEDMEYRR
jgi:hypothetical protein